jgi:protein SCO1/2
MIFLRARVVAAILALALATGALGSRYTQARELPSDSIYQLNLVLVDQDAHASKLADMRGSPVLIAMFYSSCQYVCPLIIGALQRAERAVGVGARARLRVLLVSFDPKRDTPAVLKRVAEERHIDLARWTLARTDATDVRKLAAILDVQYRELVGGDFNHSSVITLLDSDGRIVARSDNMSELDPALLAAMQQALSGAR